MRARRRREHPERRHIERADQISWGLLIFGVVRTFAWLVMMGFVALGLSGVGLFTWASHLATLVVFVTFISFYANAATDLDQVTAAWAAIRAGKAHAQGVHNEELGEDGSRALLAEIRACSERIERVSELMYSHLQNSDGV